MTNDVITIRENIKVVDHNKGSITFFSIKYLGSNIIVTYVQKRLKYL